MIPDAPKQPAARELNQPAAPMRRRSPSMHEDVELWCDCCSCEAEPRWQKVAEEIEAQQAEEREAEPPPRGDSRG